jgi:hypothetical protein
MDAGGAGPGGVAVSRPRVRRRRVRLQPKVVAWGALALALGGVVAALWPVPSTVPATAPRVEPLPPEAPSRAGGAEAVDSAVARMVRHNLFSARRRAPLVRYRDPLASPLPEDPVMAEAAQAGAGMSAEWPRLLGVARIDAQWQALVQWAPEHPAGWCAVAVRCADGAAAGTAPGGTARDRGGRVRAIAPDAVVLVVDGRERTLRLAPSRSADSLSRMP